MREIIQDYNLWLEFETKEEKLKRLNLPFYKKPSNDNEKMCNWQYEYLMNNSRVAEAKLWTGFYDLCIKAVKKEQKIRGFFADSEEIDIKAGIACDYVMRRYIEHSKSKNEIYFITNFISAAHDGMVHAVYHEEENDFILDKCKTLNGKPVSALKEIDFSILKSEKKSENKNQIAEDPGQLLLFELDNLFYFRSKK